MITVALPAFKARFLKEAMASLLSQTHRDFELIVVDDASPEPLEEIVDAFADPRVVYHRNEVNLGRRNLVANWNRCLELAGRPWFVLASDDDIYDPNFLTEMVGLASALPNVDVFHSRVAVIDVDGATRELTAGCPQWETADDFLWHRIHRARACYMPEFMIRTDRLRKMGGFIEFPAAWGSDVATCVQAGGEGGIACVNKPLLKWRRSGMNISTSKAYLDQKIQGLISFRNWCVDYFQGSDSLQAALGLVEMESYYTASLANLLRDQSIGKLLLALVGGGNKNVSRQVALRALAMKLKR